MTSRAVQRLGNRGDFGVWQFTPQACVAFEKINFTVKRKRTDKMNRIGISLLVVFAFSAVAAYSQAQDSKKNESPKSKQRSVAKSDAKRQKLLIKKMMIAVHRGPYSPAAAIDEELKKPKPDWKKLEKSAEFIESMSLILSSKSNKAAYGEYSKLTIDGIKNRKLESARKAFASFKTSCASCHGWGGNYDSLKLEKNPILKK